jgi:hypothetical protein
LWFADKAFESLTKLGGRDVVVYLTFEGVGDGTGLFGDDDADHVELFSHTDGTAVTET